MYFSRSRADQGKNIYPQIPVRKIANNRFEIAIALSILRGREYGESVFPASKSGKWLFFSFLEAFSHRTLHRFPTPHTEDQKAWFYYFTRPLFRGRPCRGIFSVLPDL
jgi:hypothetical protein